MTDDESERDEGRGQQPGADVGDDRDVPEDPLLAPPATDEPAEIAEDEEDASEPPSSPPRSSS